MSLKGVRPHQEKAIWLYGLIEHINANDSHLKAIFNSFNMQILSVIPEAALIIKEFSDFSCVGAAD